MDASSLTSALHPFIHAISLFTAEWGVTLGTYWSASADFDIGFIAIFIVKFWEARLPDPSLNHDTKLQKKSEILRIFSYFFVS